VWIFPSEEGAISLLYMLLGVIVLAGQDKAGISGPSRETTDARFFDAGGRCRFHRLFVLFEAILGLMSRHREENAYAEGVSPSPRGRHRGRRHPSAGQPGA